MNAIINNHPTQDVCLVLMPYAALERPSIALSILKTSLGQIGINSQIIYGNLLFAEEIGPHIYDMICKSQSHCLIGEWTFSKVAFPEFEADHDAYFQHVRRGVNGLESLAKAIGSQISVKDLIYRIKEKTEAYIEKMAYHVLSFEPKIVGCSSTFQQHCASLALLRKIKELAPEVTTMLGGANCESTMGIATHKNCPWLDYVFSGESDLNFPELVERILNKETPEQLEQLPEGVIGPINRKNQYKWQKKNPPRARIKDMNLSPVPDYDDYFNHLNTHEIGQFIVPGMLIESSRGCWWGAIKHCTFCGLNGESMGYRSKSYQLVLEEIKYLYNRHKVHRIEAVDNILEMKYFKTLLPELAKLEDDLEFFFETKANLNKQQIAMLAEAGIKWIQPGIESLDDTLLDLIDKGTKARYNLQMMKWTQEYGIYIIWVWLYDIPGDNDQLYLDMAEWLPLISHLQTPGGLSFIQYNRFSPYHMYPEKYNLTLEADRSYSYIYPWSKEDIEDFAYYFDEYSRDREQIQSFQEEQLDSPGLQAIKKVFHDWQKGWAKRMYPSLSELPDPSVLFYLYEGEEMHITDTRPCAVQEKHVLSGLTRIVYECCDRSLKFNSLLTILTEKTAHAITKEQLEGILNDLLSSKLMINMDGYYLSLAVRGPLKFIPPRVNYPGGRVKSYTEIYGNYMKDVAYDNSHLQSMRFV